MNNIKNIGETFYTDTLKNTGKKRVNKKEKHAGLFLKKKSIGLFSH